MITVPVDLGDRRYDVLVGDGARHLLPEVLPAGVQRVAVVTQRGIDVSVEPGVASLDVELPGGEAAKSLDQVEMLCRAFARFGLSRRDVVVAVGGGVVTDIAGFAASTYLRGVAYVNVPTTLVGQVDAAIGGKTGVNLPEGKNLVGSFWQPSAVLCDTGVLAGLPQREWASGRGEMAKYAFLAAEAGGPVSGSALLAMSLDEQVAYCVALKAAVVAGDERESGARALLNYGHTLAHALEGVALAGRGGLDLRHGEAVAVGLVFAAELALRLGRITDARVAMHREVVSAFELNPDLPPGLSAAELVSFMARDKKAHHDLTFVLDGPGGLQVVTGVSEDDVLATLSAMGCQP